MAATYAKFASRMDLYHFVIDSCQSNINVASFLAIYPAFASWAEQSFCKPTKRMWRAGPPLCTSFAPV